MIYKRINLCLSYVGGSKIIGRYLNQTFNEFVTEIKENNNAIILKSNLLYIQFEFDRR